MRACLARLDALGRRGACRRAGAPDPAPRASRGSNRFLFVEQGFRGNREDYYDPRNSYLNEVLERRTGIPITLSLVYLAVGRRARPRRARRLLPGTLPGEAACEPADWLVVDPFERALLDRDACQRRLDAALSAARAARPELHLRAASPREILARLLGNLKRIFADRGDLERTLGLLRPHPAARAGRARRAARARRRVRGAARQRGAVH